MWFLLLTALTLDASFTLVDACPTQLIIDAPAMITPGAGVSLNITTDIPAALTYAVHTNDGALVQAEKTTKGTAKVTAPKHAGPTALIIDATASKAGCPPLSANTTLAMASSAKQALPRTVSLVPWAIAGLATVLAAVLVWRR